MIWIYLLLAFGIGWWLGYHFRMWLKENELPCACQCEGVTVCGPEEVQHIKFNSGSLEGERKVDTT